MLIQSIILAVFGHYPLSELIVTEAIAEQVEKCLITSYAPRRDYEQGRQLY
jgi:hypothetical protein